MFREFIGYRVVSYEVSRKWGNRINKVDYLGETKREKNVKDVWTMCTGLTFTTQDGYHLFGRNMDVEYDYNQSILLEPRQFSWINRVTHEKMCTSYAIVGMGTLIDEHPMFADACNEKGLGCAGLNFPGYAYYQEEVRETGINLGAFDMIFWILSCFEKVEEVKKALAKVTIINKPFSEHIPIAPLHWMVADLQGECIVIEQTKEGLKVFDNPIGVLTNAPTFDWHLTNLYQFIGLQAGQPKNIVWGEKELTPLGQGIGLYGMPGDFSPASRFVRAAYLRNHSGWGQNFEQGIVQFFHILGNVAMVSGSVITPEGKEDITRYASCMCQETGVYYYTTYGNSQIRAIDMRKEDLNASNIKVFNYDTKLSIYQQKE